MASQVHCRSWHVLDISSCHGTRLQYHVLLMTVLFLKMYYLHLYNLFLQTLIMLKNTCKLNKNSYMYITFNYRLWWWNYALFWLYYFLLLIEIQVKINYYCFSLVFKFSVSFNLKQKQRTKILRKLRIKHRLKPF